MNELSQVDLAFCVDLTASMTPFIAAARAHMVEVLSALQRTTLADPRVAVVGYRDYGTRQPLLEVHPFGADVTAIRQVLDALQVASPPENTDAAEAVFAGVQACLQQLTWRPQAVRALLLIGDAPPHACGATAQPFADRFPDRDPTGIDLMGMSAAVEEAGITLHALGMVPTSVPAHDAVLEKSFAWLAQTTGGVYRAARTSADALAVVEAMGRRVFGKMDFDRRLWQELGKLAPSAVEEIMPRVQEALHAAPHEIHSGLERLRRRGLLRDETS